MCIAGSLGITVDTLPSDDPVVALFAESAGRLVVEVPFAHRDRFAATLVDDITWLGVVTDDPVLAVDGHLRAPVGDLAGAFNRGDG